MTKNEERINKLFKELVPETGKADSLAGELVRAMSRIGYRFYNDGDQLDILCGAVADYVEQNPDLRNQPTEDMWDFKDEEEDQDDSWDEEEDDWDEEDYDEEEDY